MSRKIKFRAWYHNGNKGKGKMVDNMSNREIFARAELNHYSLMQYTGLKDKNGVEIYEGDLLALFSCPERHFGCTCKKQPLPEFTGPVVYEGKGFECYEVGSDWSLYEVIGNIYENHELLNGEPS